MTRTSNEPGRSHEAHVTDQFGARAAQYVASAVHAEGEDLAALARAARGRPTGLALDLGCGGGHVAYAVAPLVRAVTAYDLSPEMLAAVAAEAVRRGLRNVVTCRGRAEDLPFPDATFDVVLSRFSAHHWGDLPAALEEVRRVLRPDGRVAFADVVAPESALLDTHLQAVELLRDASHVRDHTAAQWEAMLTGAGLVPGPPTLRRLRMEFSSWTSRMRTPGIHVAAIRLLQDSASRPVREHFAIEPDGSFTLDTMTIEARPCAPARAVG